MRPPSGARPTVRPGCADGDEVEVLMPGEPGTRRSAPTASGDPEPTFSAWQPLSRIPRQFPDTSERDGRGGAPWARDACQKRFGAPNVARTSGSKCSSGSVA